MKAENVEEVKRQEGMLSCNKAFKTKALSNLQPLGPGLNAAELRKLHHISKGEEQPTVRV